VPTLFKDNAYVVELPDGQPMNTAVGILIFAGLDAKLGQIQVREFGDFLSTKAKTIVIRDRLTGWWNFGRVEKAIKVAVDTLRQMGCTHLYTLGNSMGGSGALLAAGMLPKVERCLAFVPQSTIYMDEQGRAELSEEARKEAVEEDIRQVEIRLRIKTIRWANYWDPARSARAEKVLLFGAKADAFHKRMFAENGVPYLDVAKAHHGLVRRLVPRGRLEAILHHFADPASEFSTESVTALLRSLDATRAATSPEPAA